MAHTNKHSPTKVQVYHATAPTCWWSWGYESVLNRLPMVYGDQVEIHLLYGTVYEDLNEYLKGYELTLDTMNEWAREASEQMRIPIRANYSLKEPKTVLPATYAVLAALKQGRSRGDRFNREILRRFVVEGQDVTQASVLDQAAEAAGLGLKQFRSDFADTPALKAELSHQAHSFGHLPLGFYNVAVADGAGRTVILDYAFDPEVVEEAIDYISAGKLEKCTPTDIMTYLQHHGVAPTLELARVFGDAGADVGRQLAALEAEGKVRKISLAGGEYWSTLR